MTARHPLVLLSGASDQSQPWAAVAADLGGYCRVLAPDLSLLRTERRGSFPLGRGAAAVSSALDDAGLAAVTVCGAGLGAMVALQLAADQPDRVSRLVLITRQVRLSPLVRSLPAVVLPLLPATAIHRLGAAPEQVLALLDQVRPVDFRPLASRVQASVVVLCGSGDSLNRRASTSLVRSLPDARLELVAGARPGWVSDSPHLLSAALVELLTTST